MDYQQKYIKYKTKYLNLSKKCVIDQILPILEPTTKKFIQSLQNETPIYKLQPVDARNVLNKIQHDDAYKQYVDIEDLEINFENEQLSITIFRPKNNKNKLNTMIYVHGGGWVLGNKQTHGRLVSQLVTGATIAIVFINYSLAPESVYPHQLKQLYLSTKYICLNAIKHNLLIDKLIIGGDSVGGNMAVALLYLYGEKFKYQILLYPVVSSGMATKSYQTYENGPWLTKQSMEWFFNQYSKPNQRSDPAITLLNIPIDKLKTMPAGLIVTAENDVLRDEGEEYASKLIGLGRNIQAVRFLGTTHDFMILDPLKDTPAVVGCTNLVISHIRKFLNLTT